MNTQQRNPARTNLCDGVNVLVLMLLLRRARELYVISLRHRNRPGVPLGGLSANIGDVKGQTTLKWSVAILAQTIFVHRE